MDYSSRVSQPQHKMKKNLETFRYLKHMNVADLEKGKTIIRVEYPRKTEWWIALPCYGEADHVCVFISKVKRGYALFEEARILDSYASRITRKY